MTNAPVAVQDQLDQPILDSVKRYWGYDSLRPLQDDAIRAGIRQRDSLIVMPTGGGKSLCYQVPPIVANRVDIVVSPLISLMKDQVDGLQACGYPAAAIYSGQSSEERNRIFSGIHQEQYRLLFVSPERLVTHDFMEVVRCMSVRAFAIDEAHCISHWGHDFRPDYRQLAQLKQRFPGVSVHAFTATATPRVRADIAAQLQLENPEILVGNFDRPNLVYRIVPRVDECTQIVEVIRRHPHEAVIVYCITRKSTENIAAVLKANGINAAAYHAGMEHEQRRKTQEAFAGETLDVVVATVAFGMGIDRSNVRCVIHAAMPKSIEHYQQETGRAGRDGLEAECVMLYSAADAGKWQRLFSMNGEEGQTTFDAQIELLRHLQGLCGTINCRHRALVQYFGQNYKKENCGCCDVCLGEVKGMDGGTVLAQKILSCVARLNFSYGVKYIVQVLRGSKAEQVLQRGHDQLSTHGILHHLPEKYLTNLVYQLVDLGLLVRKDGEYPVYLPGNNALAVLRGEQEVQLIEPKMKHARKTKVDQASWEGVDRDLFEHLRELRRAIADERGVAAFVILGDTVLRSLARVRPDTLAGLEKIRGIGEKKRNDFGPRFVQAIVEYCAGQNLKANQPGLVPTIEIVRPRQTNSNAMRMKAQGMFRGGASIDRVMKATDRARSTVTGYLADLIEETGTQNIERWVDRNKIERIEQAVRKVGMDALKPIYEHLKEQVEYSEIRLVVAHFRSQEAKIST